MDPQFHLIRLRDRKTGKLNDRTDSVMSYEWQNDKVAPRGCIAIVGTIRQQERQIHD